MAGVTRSDAPEVVEHEVQSYKKFKVLDLLAESKDTASTVWLPVEDKAVTKADNTEPQRSAEPLGSPPGCSLSAIFQHNSCCH